MSEKSRIIAFMIIAAILALITIWIAAAFCSIVTSPVINTDEIDHMYVDGSDCAPIIQMGVGFMNFVVVCAFILIFGLVECVIFPVTWGIFRAVAFRNNPPVSQEELVFSRRIFLITMLAADGVSFVVMLVSSIIAGSLNAFYGLLFCWLNPLLMWGIYITKLKRSAFEK